ncbi:MAG TPA: hypothetical protein PKA27_11230 [Fimbriimonadaceae bacterium]|nr:hypothetical protein [Fimbriimonadaceae bacterium]
MKSTLIILALTLNGTAHAMILDNFTVPYSNTITSGTWVDYQTDEEIYTGERDVAMRILGATGGFTYTIGNGRVTLSTQGAGRAFAYMEYDGIGDEVNNTGPGRELIRNPRPDLHFPEGTTRVRFHIESFTGTGVFEVGARLIQNGTALFSVGRNSSEAGVSVIDVPFHPDAFAVCNTIEIRFGLQNPNSTLVISTVELVPELNTLTGVLGAGALFGVRRLRKRNS